MRFIQLQFLTLLLFSGGLPGQTLSRLELLKDTEFVVTTDLLEVDTLIMHDNASLKLVQAEVTIIINYAVIGRGCKIDAKGDTGRDGTRGTDGTSVEAGGAFSFDNDGRDGENGQPGSDSKLELLWIEEMSYLSDSSMENTSFEINISGGDGGRGGDGGDGGTRAFNCGEDVPPPAIYGLGGYGGDGVRGGHSTIYLGPQVDRKYVLITNKHGTFGSDGKYGKIGQIRFPDCPGDPEYTIPDYVTPIKPPRKTTAVLSPYELTSIHFPYPPPSPSALISDLPLREKDELLGEVNQRLRKALKAGGYENLRYFKFPEGYAVVTGMEQVTEDGVPLEGADRWSSSARFVKDFSLVNYLRSLFTARKGYFRLIVFIVSSNDMATKNKRITRGEALGWFKTGWSRLPEEIGQLPFTEAHYVSALIYEFSISENADGPVFSEPSLISAEEHLRGANLWPLLIAE